MKRHYSLLWFVIYFGIIFPSVYSVQAGKVFSDDFDDGDLEGWDLWGWNWTTPIIYEWEGSMINDNGILTSENPQNGMWSYACQESTVAYGTWSFDWLPSAINARDFVSFISEDTWDWVNSTQIKTAYSYYLWLNPGNAGVIQGIQLQKHSGTTLDVNVGTYTALEGLEGWHSLDVTRTINGQFKIFIDGELVIEETDTDVTESTKFCFGLDGDSAFDNVRISDSVDIHLSGGSLNVFLYVIGLISAGGIGFFLLKYFAPSFSKADYKLNKKLIDHISDVIDHRPYLFYLIFGASLSDTDHIEPDITRKVPIEIQNYKFLLHPIR
ncbi:MAG: hypothetical protein ACW99Q_26910, partial [Candidatus Kariarchaeaceae archaeon]